MNQSKASAESESVPVEIDSQSIAMQPDWCLSLDSSRVAAGLGQAALRGDGGSKVWVLPSPDDSNHRVDVLA